MSARANMLPTRNFSAFLIPLMTLCAISPQPSIAQGFTGYSIVRIGELSLRIPVPDGFVETSAASPSLWREAQSFVPSDGRVITHYVLHEEFEVYRKGKPTVFSRYLFAETTRSAESIVATQAQFDRLRQEAVRQQNDLTRNIEPDLAIDLDRLSKSLSSKEHAAIVLRVGQVVPVSININRHNLLSYTVMAQTEGQKSGTATTRTMLVTIGMCFVKGKLISLNDYRQLRSAKDLQATRDFIDQWANALFASN